MMLHAARWTGGGQTWAESRRKALEQPCPYCGAKAGEECREMKGKVMSEQDIIEIVDEFVDALDPASIDRECERLGVTVDEMLRRIAVEVKARLA